jgi:hypothetical protein
MTLTQQRRFVSPEKDETVEALAARALPDTPLEDAVDQIKSWNLHIFALRRPPGLLLGSDVVFVEPPAGAGAPPAQETETPAANGETSAAEAADAGAAPAAQ